MKTLLLLPICILFAANIQAQQQLRQALDNQYLNQTHKQFIYQVSPQARQADLHHLDLFYAFEATMENSINEAYSDTSWTYREEKLEGDSVYHPQNFTYSFSEDIGDNAYHSYFQQIKFVDDTTHYLERNQISSYSNDWQDSSKTLYYNAGESVPYSGYKYIYPEDASEGASREQIWEAINANTGEWDRQARYLYYREEGGYDTLTVTYSWDVDTQEEYLSEERRYRVTNEYELNETKRYYKPDADGQQPITSWSYQYTLKGEGEHIIYSISKTLNSEGDDLMPQDSLTYDYNTDGKVKGFQYSWQDAQYLLTATYEAFYSTIGETEVSDSVIVYNVEFNEETGMYEQGSTQTKTVMEYNEDAQQTYIANYNNNGEGLQKVNETHYTYDSEGRQVKTISYNQDHLSGQLFKVYEFIYRYNEQGSNISTERLYFDVEGNISRGTRNEMATVERDGFQGYKNFEWNLEMEDWVVTRVLTRGLEAGDSIAQTSDYRNGYYSRSINSGLSEKKVAVLNDGPIFLSSQDTTLLFYISAWTININRPNVEIIDLPEGATFNPVTHRFYWEVDEPVNTTMTVRAFNIRDTVETVVEFVADEITVDNEDIEQPHHFTLAQNYPNPFNPTTVIRYELTNTAKVQLEIFDMLGRKVKTLVNTRKAAGAHIETFNASALSSGMYIYRLRAGDFTATRKMMLIK